MEVLLYNSRICRLCAADNSNGTLLFSSNEGEQILGDLINNYLPLKVSDDGKLPQTICPGCNIQLEATVEFFNLIIIGQKVIRDLAQRETESLRNSSRNGSNENENIVFQTFTSDGQMYTLEHPVSLKMDGLDKPKRKRGRPPKKPKPEEPETPIEPPIEEPVIVKEESQPIEEVIDGTRKRRRKTPQRFKEAVQGKELERMFREEGVLDGEESDSEKPRARIIEEEGPDESGGQGQVIGHMEAPDGQPLGQLVVLNKGKGSGRPKGRTKWQRTQRCAACGVAFACARRYMRHVAAHGALRYACTTCTLICDNLLELTQHHDETGHRGHSVVPTENAAAANTTESEADSQPSEGETRVDTADSREAEADTGPENAASSEEQSMLLNETDDVAVPEASKQSENVEVTVTLPASIGKYACPQCDKVFNTNQSKVLHVRATHAGERPYKCTECSATFPYPRSLAKHMVVHARRNNAGYACDLCGKVLKHPSSVTYHKEAAHGSGQRYVCSRCNKPFKHRQLLQRHQLVHSDARPFLCKLCPSSFKTKANLMNHQAVHSGIKKFVCEICNHSFAHKTSLTLHLRWHSGQKPFVCNVCGKAFSQKGNLSEHARIHTGEKPYACAHCPRTFTTSSQRRLHAQRHAGHRPFHCTYCSKRFLSKESWRAHMRRHRGELPFVCACGRAFAERWALHKHSRCHSGERPYACPHCTRTFADCSNLAKHKLIHREATEVNSLNAEVEATDIASSEENKVVYVTYGQKDGIPTFHILAPEQAAQLGADEEPLFEEEEDDVVVTEQPAEEEEQQQIEVLHADHISIELPQQPLPVTDEQGNPIHLTMQDGTQLAITSSDGRSLQVTTEDGETIPVELNRNLQLKEKMEDGQNEFHITVQEGTDLNSVKVSNEGRTSHMNMDMNSVGIKDVVSNEGRASHMNVDINSVGIKDVVSNNSRESHMDMNSVVTKEDMQGILGANTADGQTVRLLTTFDDNTFSHYFTIV